MRTILIEGAKELGLSMSDSAVDAFGLYFRLLEERNSVMNLTAISGAQETARLHFLDCLALLSLKGVEFPGKSLIDVGSGAGFPGLPMKIAEQSLRLTLLDAQQKRVGFLREVCAALCLRDVDCTHGRAEDAALRPPYRDGFDIAVSRAVARLNVLCELCLPFVRTGGAFIAMKGAETDEELREAENAVATLGGIVESVTGYTIPGTAIKHSAVVIRKTGPTPAGYPRRYARIEKKPL